MLGDSTKRFINVKMFAERMEICEDSNSSAVALCAASKRFLRVFAARSLRDHSGVVPNQYLESPFFKAFGMQTMFALLYETEMLSANRRWVLSVLQ